MNYKKYLLFLLFIMIIGCNKIYASSENYYDKEKNEIVNINSNFKHNQGNLINILDVDCKGIFGDKNNPDSLSNLINEILQYPKIIVPILVIVLGILDLGKAVIAGKEDEMKKAQKTFVKRLILGVVFFFIPVIVNIIMWLADIVWNGMYTSCRL